MPEIAAMQETMKQMNDKYAGEMKTMEDEFQKKYNRLYRSAGFK